MSEAECLQRYTELATITREAFPHLFYMWCGLNVSVEQRQKEIVKLAKEAILYGWVVIDGKAYLPVEFRAEFYKAVGLPVPK